MDSKELQYTLATVCMLAAKRLAAVRKNIKILLTPFGYLRSSQQLNNTRLGEIDGRFVTRFKELGLLEPTFLCVCTPCLPGRGSDYIDQYDIYRR